MYKWTRLKIALLAVTTTLTGFGLSGCLGESWWTRVTQYVLIGNLFD